MSPILERWVADCPFWTVEPGCCFGLEERRDWLDVLAQSKPGRPGGTARPVVRARCDEDLITPEFTGPHIDIPRDALPGLLEEVRQDLLNFLDALGDWARTTVPARSDRLVTTVAGAW